MEPNGESTAAQAADASRDVAVPAAEGETGTNGHNGQTAETPPAAADTPVAEAIAEAPAPAAPAKEPAAEAPAGEAPAAQAPAAETPAPDAVVDAPAPAPPAGDAPAETPAVAVTPDAERPAVGPRILGVAAEPKPLPTVKATLPKPKRRRRPSAAERHRRAFFSALTDLRRGGTMPAAAPAEQDAPADETAPAEATAAESPAVETPAVEAPAVEAPAVEAPAAETPAAETPATETEAAPAAEEPAAPGTDRSPTSPARVIAAIERVGGAEVIKEALKPKQDEKGQPLKWAAVCAQSAEGMKPGDPVFNAWVRLAATPVREVKGLLPRPPEAERSERGPGGRRPGQQRSGGGRPRRDDRPNRSEYASHAQDGKLRTSIRIITGHDEDQERRERERNRKEQREAKRRAERERLARLGY